MSPYSPNRGLKESNPFRCNNTPKPYNNVSIGSNNDIKIENNNFKRFLDFQKRKKAELFLIEISVYIYCEFESEMAI